MYYRIFTEIISEDTAVDWLSKQSDNEIRELLGKTDFLKYKSEYMRESFITLACLCARVAIIQKSSVEILTGGADFAAIKVPSSNFSFSDGLLGMLMKISLLASGVEFLPSAQEDDSICMTVCFDFSKSNDKITELFLDFVKSMV